MGSDADKERFFAEHEAWRKRHRLRYAWMNARAFVRAFLPGGES